MKIETEAEFQEVRKLHQGQQVMNLYIKKTSATPILQLDATEIA
jgi:hypothetical protein